MKTKIIGILVVMLLISIVIYPSMNSLNMPDDYLDQEQAECDIMLGGWPVNNIAQSFKPTLNILTRIEFYVERIGMPDITQIIIRKDSPYNDEYLSQLFVYSIDIPENEEVWFEFDIPDIYVEPEETYFIVLLSTGGVDNRLKTGEYWGNPYERGEKWESFGVWNVMEDCDCTFRTYGYYDENAGPDLICEGDLNWQNITTRSKINASFTLKNAGTDGSLLDWEIVEYPNWGTWNFSSDHGDDLLPTSGEKTININIIAPDEKAQEYTGNLKIINKGNNEDYEIIPVSLITPKNKTIVNSILMRFLEYHPYMFPLLHQLLVL